RHTSAAAPASTENATVIAQNAPSGPSSSPRARNQARGISSVQNTARTSQVGVQVSPAPLNACDSTIPKAYSGKPSDTIRSARTAISDTSTSAANSATMSGANITNNPPSVPRNARLIREATQTDASARPGLRAPSAWPTIVAAALDRPHAGIRPKITSRIATV